MNAIQGTTSSQASTVIVEKHLTNAPRDRHRTHDLQLTLDETDGECQGYVVTVNLPASFLSKVSRVRLQAA